MTTLPAELRAALEGRRAFINSENQKWIPL